MALKTRVRSLHPIPNLSSTYLPFRSSKSHYVLFTDTEQPPQQSALSNARSPNNRNLRGTRRINAQATKLEAVGDEIDPLGPLGDKTGESSSPLSSNEQAPEPPQKESFAAHNVRPTSSTSQASGLAGMMDSVNLEENGAGFRVPPPVQPPAETEATKRQSQPSVSIEQAAKPVFEIVVGDPHKVGDLTSSHIVYQVRTKVGRIEYTRGVKGQLRGLTDVLQTSSKAYRQPEFAVSRRYRDFLWLYNSLHNNNPGVVVAPPPEKQAVGRFDTNFVESRRAALERMLNKIAGHPILQHDGDLKIFLESETFSIDVKNKENREPDLGQNKGMFSSFGINVGGGIKFVEHDDVSCLSLRRSSILFY